MDLNTVAQWGQNLIPLKGLTETMRLNLNVFAQTMQVKKKVPETRFKKTVDKDQKKHPETAGEVLRELLMIKVSGHFATMKMKKQRAEFSKRVDTLIFLKSLATAQT